MTQAQMFNFEEEIDNQKINRKNRGFEMLEVLLVPYGGSKNDTIVTVEAKRERNQMSIFDMEEYEE